jgi:hypothetical protein
MAYSKENKDWVHKWIQEYGGDDTHVKQWATEKIKRSAMVKKSAKKFGYGYFDVTERPFKKHIAAVTNYLLR